MYTSWGQFIYTLSLLFKRYISQKRLVNNKQNRLKYEISKRLRGGGGGGEGVSHGNQYLFIATTARFTDFFIWPAATKAYIFCCNFCDLLHFLYSFG